MNSTQHPRPRAWHIAALIAATALPFPAAAVIEPDFERGTGPALTTWYGQVSDAALQADRAYVSGMRPHHAGALTMSQDYLKDPAASSPMLLGLARMIIVNQQFEVLLLDEVARNLDQPPVSLPFGVKVRPLATEGLAQRLLFRREPMPGPIGWTMGPVSKRDVQFAKAMTIHHQGAIDMAREYHANGDARNGFLGLFNVDVVTDQSQEIAMMRWVMSAYPGDLDAVTVDASMVHGMEGMAGHGAHATPAKAVADPHAGHVMPAAQPVADPHEGHAMPVAKPGRDPHEGHGTAAKRVAADPHAGHRAAQPPRRPPAKAAARPAAKPAEEDHSNHKH